MLTHGNRSASCEALRLAWRWTAHDRLVLALPLFHVHGLGVGLHGTLLARRLGGAPPALRRRRGARRRARRTTRRSSSACPRCTPRLATSASGSPSSPGCASASRARRRCRPRCTTTLARPGRRPRPRALRHDRDDHERVEPLRRRAAGRAPSASRSPASRCGSTSRRARSCCAARTCSPATGAARRRPRAAFTDDGWFRTGDVGARRCRRLPAHRRSGQGADHLAVATTCTPARWRTCCSSTLRSRRSRWWGSRPTSGASWWSPSSCPRPTGTTPTPLLAFAAEHLAPYKRPRRVRYVDELPRNALGKVVRSLL